MEPQVVSVGTMVVEVGAKVVDVTLGASVVSVGTTIVEVGARVVDGHTWSFSSLCWNHCCGSRSQSCRCHT